MAYRSGRPYLCCQTKREKAREAQSGRKRGASDVGHTHRLCVKVAWRRSQNRYVLGGDTDRAGRSRGCNQLWADTVGSGPPRAGGGWCPGAVQLQAFVAGSSFLREEASLTTESKRGKKN